jgi:hypothetical protein
LNGQPGNLTAENLTLELLRGIRDDIARVNARVDEAQLINKNLILWGKIFLVVTVFLTGLALAFFGYDLKNAREAALTSEMEAHAFQIAAQGFAADAKDKAEHASLDSQKLLADTEKKNEEVKKKIDDQRQYIDAQVVYITGRVGGVKGEDYSQLGDNLKNLGETIKALQTQVAELQKKAFVLTSPEAAPSQEKIEPLSPEEVTELDEILRIKQTASKAGGLTLDGSRQSYDLSFTVCALVGGTCGDSRLDDVSRVVYRFDPHWFSVPNVPVADRSTQFKYGLRVWGVTRVRACIFLKRAPDRPIVRAGLMSLAEEPSYWDPELSATADRCANLNGL